jgi:hypothetical protein
LRHPDGIGLFGPGRTACVAAARPGYAPAMTQRDYEIQPEAPDLGASVQLENSEHLAGPPGSADGLDAGYVPPDRPYGADDPGVTPAGMRDGESHDERLARERPDTPVGEGEEDRSGRLATAGEGAALETLDAMDAVDVGVDGGAASAEEAAVHETEPVEPLDAERPVEIPVEPDDLA